MKKPEISVVMSVYNGEKNLAATLQSILNQEDCDFEFIVVNDGSSDASGRILEEWAAMDSRMRVIHQKNAGLTKSLIRGCAAARGQFVARQDVGDISLPHRLVKQLALIKQDKNVVAVYCYTKQITPERDIIDVMDMNQKEMNRRLRSCDENVLYTPSHGSVLFRKSVYTVVKGYREHFYFAQDLDLWTRMANIGVFRAVPEVLYELMITPDSISGMYAEEQRKLKAIIAQACIVRLEGGSEEAILDMASKIKPKARRVNRNKLANGNYYIGSRLNKNNPSAATKYFNAAILHDPLHLRSWIKLIECKLIRYIKNCHG